MKKWDLVAIVAEVGGAICTVVGLIAASKKNDNLKATVHKLMLEDKSYGKRHRS